MNFSFRHCLALAAVACAGLAMAPMADAKTFKWANSGDVSSMDPYARQETFLLTFTSNIYDPLVRRDKNLKLEPALAKWGQVDPTTGSSTSAGCEVPGRLAAHRRRHRVLAQRANGPGSNMQSNFVSVKGDQEGRLLRVVTTVSRPAARRQMAGARHDVKAWAEKTMPQLGGHDQEQENFATRNAMGTGPSC
jgi:peptide/nickel transport system substrate-binding protein